MALMFLAFTLDAVSAESVDTDNIDIYLSEIDGDKLEVLYTLDRAATSLQFQTTPDQSRVKFWRAKSEEFEFIHLAGNDVIRRVDGKPFQSAVFDVDIVDISLPNYYRPFSPLFDRNNGLVIHTGQYFVCAESCANRPTVWQIQISASDQNIIHYEKSSVSKASWQDSLEGRPFYVGPRSPLEGGNLVAIIDPGLPIKLKTMLDTELPSVIKRLTEKFDALPTKPLVFATYNEGDPERSGFQGSVLNQTVVMHWWGRNLEERINESGELWFITHEIAHFYQSQESAVDIDEVAWIHEGFAELMAADLLAQTNDELEDYVQQRYKAAESSCADGLRETAIGQATQLKQFDLHYKCGMLIHRFITNNAKERITTFELWNRYRVEINQGLEPSKKTYLDLVKQVLPKEHFLVLETIVGSELTPANTIKQFIVGATF